MGVDVNSEAKWAFGMTLSAITLTVGTGISPYITVPIGLVAALGAGVLFHPTIVETNKPKNGS